MEIALRQVSIGLHVTVCLSSHLSSRWRRRSLVMSAPGDSELSMSNSGEFWGDSGAEWLEEAED
jgi:hypothetical protein